MGLHVNNRFNNQDQTVQSNLFDSLPFKYQNFQTTEYGRPTGFRFYSDSMTITAGLHGKEIIVCGEDFDLQTATAKAISELIERSVLIQCALSNPSKYKTSNGWAAHFERESAEFNAILEIVERDAILAQWYSCTPFMEIQTATTPSSIMSWIEDELSQSEFPIFKILLSTKGLGPSVTCILMNESGFGVCGHSSKVDLLQAVENAIGEACRAAHLTLRNAHYEDTEILRNATPGIKINPGTHAVYYAYQEAFPNWMFGEKITWFNAIQSWISRMTQFQESEINNFTVETKMTEPVFVCFARHEKAFDLFWGPTAPGEVQKLAAFHRLNMKQINFKPHPIS